MSEQTQHIADRRPIAARKLAIVNRLANWMARVGVSPNGISVAGAVCGIAGGVALASTAWTNGISTRLLWLTGALFVQLRLQANLFDGMVAIASGKASAYGELFNEVPDRISDPATLIGFGFAVGSWPLLGWLAALLAVLTAYVRVLGKAAGAGTDFSGPMAKQHRMFVVTMACMFCALTPLNWQTWRPAVVALWIVVLGSALTAMRRLHHIAGKLRATK